MAGTISPENDALKDKVPEHIWSSTDDFAKRKTEVIKPVRVHFQENPRLAADLPAHRPIEETLLYRTRGLKLRLGPLAQRLKRETRGIVDRIIAQKPNNTDRLIIISAGLAVTAVEIGLKFADISTRRNKK